MAKKELIFNSISLWGGCGGLESTDFNSFYFGKGCSLESIEF